MTDGILSLLGQPTEYQRKLTAWNKARPIAGYDAGVWRIDDYNRPIKWTDYGLQTPYGWEIDHILPQSQFPTKISQPSNLRALHWQSNRAKADKIDSTGLNGLLRGLL